MNAVTTLATAVLDRAATHVTATQDASGSWINPPEPRLLESGLICHALALAGAPAEVVARGRGWLISNSVSRQHDPIAIMTENAVRDLALEKAVTVDLSHPGLVNPVLRWRAALVQALVLHAGQWADVFGDDAGERLTALRGELDARFDGAQGARLRIWSVVEAAAARILVANAAGDQETVRAMAETIARAQGPDGSISGMPVSTALAAIALAVARPDGPEHRSATRYLADCQREDGGWSLITCDGWDTIVTVWAFREHPDFRRLSLASAVAFLESAQHDDGGFPYAATVEPDLDSTAAALHALTGIADDSTIAKAVELYRRHQLPDGLWNTYYYAKDVPTDDCVAHIVSALAAVPELDPPSIERARQWLTERFERDEEFLCVYRNRPYTFDTIGAAIGYDHPAVQAAARAVVAAQNADGGWGQEAGEASCASATGAAIACLVHTGLADEAAMSRAVRYLADAQRPDGSWPGPPELLGPRPLLSHAPLQSHAVVATGLTALVRRGPMA